MRFRRKGFSAYLSGTPWSPEFMAQYALALDGERMQAQNIGAGRAVAGSVDALVAVYLDSSPFKAGAAETQRTRRNILERFREEHGGKPIYAEANGRRTMLLTRAHVQVMVNAKAKTPHGQRNFLNTLRAMFKWARAEGRIPDDPSLGVTREKAKTAGYRTWAESDITRFEAHHPIGTKARLAFGLMLYTGLRRCDAVRAGPAAHTRRRPRHRAAKSAGQRDGDRRDSGASQIAGDYRCDEGGGR